MNNTVFRTLVDKCGVVQGDRIIVALSGGADSVTLLHILLALKEEGMNLELFASHVNHNLRGAESQRDEEFVRSLCKGLGVRLYVLSKDVNSYAKENAKSIELAAREVRYEFFEKLSKELCAKVATAHTLSDSQETMLYNICRGASLHGLCSIPYKRDYIIRPLLDVTRTQVEDYCKSHNIDFVQDSTNFDENMCKRNKLRLGVMPQLKTINDGFDMNFLRLRENLLLADDFMQTEAENAINGAICEYGYDAKKLLANHSAVLRYALSLIIRKAGCEADSKRINLCEEILASGGGLQLCDDTYAVCKQGIFRIVKADGDKVFFEIPFEAGKSFVYKNKNYHISLIDRENIVNRKLSSFCIDYDKISKDTLIRTRKAGDTFTPAYRGVKKPLRKLQNELKIPAEKRDSSLVVATGNTILWAEHIGASAQGAVSKGSLQAYFIDTAEL